MTIDEIIDHLSVELPEGYSVHLEVKSGDASVQVRDAEGELFDIDDIESDWEELIQQALYFAHARNEGRA